MSADTIDEEPESTTFLTGLAFLTGEDPNVGSFLLVVGITTCVFVAGFQFLLPDPVSHLLTGLVLMVAVMSFIAGIILDSFDYFEVPPDEA